MPVDKAVHQVATVRFACSTSHTQTGSDSKLSPNRLQLTDEMAAVLTRNIGRMLDERRN
jgi:hypothetical protein